MLILSPSPLQETLTVETDSIILHTGCAMSSMCPIGASLGEDEPKYVEYPGNFGLRLSLAFSDGETTSETGGAVSGDTDFITYAGCCTGDNCSGAFSAALSGALVLVALAAALLA